MYDGCDWEDYVDKIEEMQGDSDYDFAESTLIGILDWVEDNEHITEKQQDAIDNIYSSKR